MPSEESRLRFMVGIIAIGILVVFGTMARCLKSTISVHETGLIDNALAMLIITLSQPIH
jgi:hypothetical protein